MNIYNTTTSATAYKAEKPTLNTFNEETGKTQFEENFFEAGIELHLPKGVSSKDLVGLTGEEFLKEVYNYRITIHTSQRQLEKMQSYSNDQILNDTLYDTSVSWLNGLESKEEKFNITFYDSLTQAKDSSGVSVNVKPSFSNSFDPNNPEEFLKQLGKPIYFLDSSEVITFLDSFIAFYEQNLEWGKENDQYFQKLNATENLEFFREVKLEYQKRVQIEKYKQEEAQRLIQEERSNAQLNKIIITS